MATGQDIVNWCAANAGKFPYSQTGDRLHPETSGITDCSGLAAAAYRIVAGLDIGTYTDNEINTGSAVFGTDENSVNRAQSLLQPGDLVFYQWRGHDGGPYWDHVEVYAGSGQLWSQSGDPLYGPKLVNFADEWGQANLIAARRYIGADVPAATAAPQTVAAVTTAPTPSVPHIDFPAWGIPGNEYYGLVTGPDASHGGFYDSEKPAVRAIQKWLIAHGYVPGVGDIGNGWADGLFEQPTADAVAAFQRAEMPGTEYYGQVWHDDWDQMTRNNG